MVPDGWQPAKLFMISQITTNRRRKTMPVAFAADEAARKENDLEVAPEGEAMGVSTHKPCWGLQTIVPEIGPDVHRPPSGILLACTCHCCLQHHPSEHVRSTRNAVQEGLGMHAPTPGCNQSAKILRGEGARHRYVLAAGRVILAKAPSAGLINSCSRLLTKSANTSAL